MWENYESYCDEMRRFGVDPLPREIWQREYVKKTETTEIMVCSHQNESRPVAPTLSNHEHHEHHEHHKNPEKPKQLGLMIELEMTDRANFTNADEYFDYIEANQILNEIRNTKCS